MKEEKKFHGEYYSPKKKKNPEINIVAIGVSAIFIAFIVIGVIAGIKFFIEIF